MSLNYANQKRQALTRSPLDFFVSALTLSPLLFVVFSIVLLQQVFFLRNGGVLKLLHSLSKENAPT